MKKKFERPELIIIFLENDLLTAVSGGDYIDNGNDENSGGFDYPPKP